MRLILLLVLVCVQAGLGSDPTRCATCTSVLGEKFYWVNHPALADKQAVCEPCSKLASKCFVCRMPVRQQGRQLSDGRWLCAKHHDVGVFSELEALRIYEETRRELTGILTGHGVMPSTISVSLVDGTQLRKQNQAMPSAHEDFTIVGLTRTKWDGKKDFQHSISLLNGLSRERLAAVCAHEYTHAWLHENIPQGRQLDRDTVEGFCELVAFKLMTQRKEEIEKKVILANAYTRGQVNAFVQAESAQHFHRIIDWVKTGVDSAVPESNQGAELTTHASVTPPAVWPPPAALHTLVPDTLVLKGISGSKSRMFALINDCTLTRNEEGKVRIGATNLVVRCIEIRERSVVIQVKGSEAKVELFLGRNGFAANTSSP